MSTSQQPIYEIEDLAYYPDGELPSDVLAQYQNGCLQINNERVQFSSQNKTSYEIITRWGITPAYSIMKIRD